MVTTMAQTALAYIMFRYPDGRPVTVARKDVVRHLYQGYRWEPPVNTHIETLPNGWQWTSRQWPGDPFNVMVLARPA